MNMYKEKNNQRIYTWFAAVVIISFAILRFSDLSLPYFWDEMGVYSRGALYLSEHGLSLFPSALPPELSRGHPLSFFFVYACGFALLGKSVIVGHSISLIVAILLLVAVYKKTSLYYNRMIAFSAVVLLCSQPVFIAQSTLILPEIALALLSFLALASYYERKLLWFAIYSTLALQIKESAIIIPFVAIAYGFMVDVILKRKTGYFSFSSVFLTFSSLLFFGIFLLIQKMQNGWFFFPYHVDDVLFDPARFFYGNHLGQKFLFFHQGRYWWVKVFIVAAIMAFAKSRLKVTNSFAILCGLFVCALHIFGCLTFYGERYLLPAFPGFIVMLAISLYTIYSNRIFVLGLTITLALLCLRDIDPGYFNYDSDLGFKHHLSVQQKLIDKLCEVAPDGSSFSGNFPLYIPLSEEHTGFRVCNKILHPIESKTANEYEVFTSGDRPYPPLKENSKLIYHIKESFVEGFIYERRK